MTEQSEFAHWLAKVEEELESEDSRRASRSQVESRTASLLGLIGALGWAFVVFLVLTFAMEQL